MFGVNIELTFEFSRISDDDQQKGFRSFLHPTNPLVKKKLFLLKEFPE